MEEVVDDVECDVTNDELPPPPPPPPTAAREDNVSSRHKLIGAGGKTVSSMSAPLPGCRAAVFDTAPKSVQPVGKPTLPDRNDGVSFTPTTASLPPTASVSSAAVGRDVQVATPVDAVAWGFRRSVELPTLRFEADAALRRGDLSSRAVFADWPLAFRRSPAAFNSLDPANFVSSDCVCGDRLEDSEKMASEEVLGSPVGAARLGSKSSRFHDWGGDGRARASRAPPDRTGDGLLFNPWNVVPRV